MKKLLIHNNNTSFNEPASVFPLSDQFLFEMPVEPVDADVYMNDLLVKDPLWKKVAEAEILFIKVALSENYLEYLGIRLAYHIRLTKSLGEKANVPIVFIAEETFQFLGITYDEPSILFTKGIYLISEDQTSLQRILVDYSEHRIKPLIDRKQFIDSIIIRPPSNYLSHHSVANEWSLLQWSKVLEVPTDHTMVRTAKQHIDSLLYYKYLLAKFPAEPDKDKVKYFIPGSGRIMYIDDEWDKGWNTVLKHLFDISRGIQFITLDLTFKEMTEDHILIECCSALLKLSPDVVLLDLRLADGDFLPDKKAADLSGFKVLKAIKAINPGIRVVVFTASNKTWNLIGLIKEGANGFVLKESPEFGIEKAGPRAAMKRLCNTVEEQLKYKFQKDFIANCSMINELLGQVRSSDKSYNDFVDDLKSQIRLIRSSVELIDLDKPDTLNMTFLNCYIFMEQFKYFVKFDDSERKYLLGTQRKSLYNYKIEDGGLNKGEYKENNSPGWFTTLAAVFIDYFAISKPPFQDIKDLKSLSMKRNTFIHKHPRKPQFSIDEIRTILRLILQACENMRE